MLLGFRETKKILRDYKIPFLKTQLVETKEEAKRVAEKIGWPVVLKISSPEILHRTEEGLLELELQNEKELEKAFDRILQRVKGRKIEGILVQKMARGIEVVYGMKRDASFGPVLMFGLGGIFVEVLKDVTFQIAPISKKEAFEMIRGIKGYKVLKGYRSMKGVNLQDLVKILISLSKLSQDYPEIKAIDFNPVICNEKEAKVVDAKIIV